MTDIKPIPIDSSKIIPMLICNDVASEIGFCKYVFEAVVHGDRSDSDGNIIHSLLSINQAMIIIEAEWPTLSSRTPNPDGSSPVVIFVYVANVDNIIARAITAGARILQPVKNQFWGDRTARIIDPSGHVWIIASRIEDTSSAERAQRWSEIVKGSDMTQDV